MTTKAHAVLGQLSNLVHGVDAIEGIVKEVLGDDTKDAFEALHIIAVIIDALRAGFDNKLTPEAVRDEIKTLRASILSGDAAADQALHDKFDKS